MKLLYIQDFHLSGNSPVNRKDNFYQSMLIKLDETLSIAKTQKVDLIIDGGDFFNREIVSNTIVDDVLDRIESSGIDWAMLYGNHCMVGNNINVSQSSSLAHIFRRSKLVTYLDEINEKFCYIKSYDYKHGIEQEIKDDGLFCEETEKLKIAVVHSMLTIKPFHPDVLHVVAKDIKTNYDIILCAHYHIGWGIKEINGVKFINISALGRRAINESKIQPQVLLIDTETKKLEIIKLKNVKPVEECFDLTKIEEKNEWDGEMEKFISSLDNVKTEGLNLRGEVENVGKQQNIDREIIKLITDEISKFEKEVN